EGVPIARGEKPEDAVTQCKECGAVWRAGSRSDCPLCGWMREGPSAPVVRDRPLYDAREKIDEKNTPRGPLIPNATARDKDRKLTERRAIASEHKYKPGWVRMRFRAIYGHFPEATR